MSTDEPLQALSSLAKPDVYGLLKGQRALNLSYESVGKEGADTLAKAIEGGVGLTSLDLERSELGAGGAVTLGAALATSDLTRLDLTGNGLRPADAASLARSLASNKTLTALKLGYNCIGAVGGQHLAGSLGQLCDLELGYNGLGLNGGIPFAKALEGNTQLTRLDLAANGLGQPDAKAFAAALRVNRTLRVLDLRYDNIGSGGAIAMAEALPLARLERLNLWSNAIGPSGAEAIAAALRQKTSLRALDLGDNGLMDKGVIAVARAMPDSTLLGLDLECNAAGASCADALADAIARGQLTHLSVERNALGPGGAVPIASALGMVPVPPLTSLNISDNELAGPDFAALLQAVDANVVLRQLKCGGNELEPPPEIAAAMARNAGLPSAWMAVAQVVRLSDSPGIRAIGNAMSQSGFGRAVFRFFLPSLGPGRELSFLGRELS